MSTPPQHHHMQPVAPTQSHPHPGYYADPRGVYQYTNLPPPGQLLPPPLVPYFNAAHVAPFQLPVPHYLPHPHPIGHTYPHRDPSTCLYTDEAAAKLSDQIRRRCFNCCGTVTSTWRRSSLNPGKILCNKCGLYERSHSLPRPEHVRISRERGLRARAAQAGPAPQAGPDTQAGPATAPASYRPVYPPRLAAHPYAHPYSEAMPRAVTPVRWPYGEQPGHSSPNPGHAGSTLQTSPVPANADAASSSNDIAAQAEVAPSPK